MTFAQLATIYEPYNHTRKIIGFDTFEGFSKVTDYDDNQEQGGVVVFDELNCKNFPGETLAVMEVFGLSKLKLRKTKFDPWISYAIIE